MQCTTYVYVISPPFSFKCAMLKLKLIKINFQTDNKETTYTSNVTLNIKKNDKKYLKSALYTQIIVEFIYEYI